MTKILTTMERINDTKIWRKYRDVVRAMTVYDFDRTLWKHGEELNKHYNVWIWGGPKSGSLTDYELGLANLLADHENVSLLRYKRLVA